MATIFDLTPQEVLKLIEWLSVPEQEIALKSDMNALRQSLRNDLLNPATWQDSSVVSGWIYPSRSNRFEYVSVDTEALSASDFLDNISTTNYSEGDMIFMRLNTFARKVICRDESVTGTGNLRLQASTLNLGILNSGLLALILIGGYWVQASAYPGYQDILEVRRKTNAYAFSYVVGGELNAGDASTIYALGELQGEVLASFDVTIGSPGSAGSVEVLVDTWDGLYSLGSFSYSGGPTEASVRASVVGIVNAGTGVHGWTAVDTGAVVRNVAPVGSGADPNSWTGLVETGGASVASVTSALAGGVSGVP
jgi:hypothetical protein